MKLAKKLSAITLASTMVVTAVPNVFAEEVTAIEAPAVEEVSVVEEAPVVEETPVVEVIETVDKYAVNDQAGVNQAKNSVQASIDVAKTKVQKEYTYKSWVALQNAVKKAEALLTATFNEGSAQKFEYIDENGESQALEEGAYKNALTHESTGVKKEIDDAIDGLKSIKDFSAKIAEVEKLRSDDYRVINTSNATLGWDSVDKSLAEIVAKAKEVERQLLVDATDSDNLFGTVGTSSTANTLMKYLTDVSADSNKSLKVAFLEAIEKADEIVKNDKSKYTLKTYNVLKTALETAKAVNPDEAIQDNIDSLNNGVSQLVSLVPLQVELERLNGLKLNESDYTANSWKASQELIDDAKDNLSKALKDVEATYTAGDVATDAANVVKAMNKVADGTNAEGYVLVSIKDLKDAVTKAETAKTGADSDYTPTSLSAYLTAVGNANKLLTQANNVVDDTIDWDAVNAELTAVNNDALGLNLNNDKWEDDLSYGLVNIKEAKALYDENKDLLSAGSQADLTDYVYNTDWENYVSAVNALNTEITTDEGSATRQSVKDKVDAVVAEKAKLLKVNKGSMKELIQNAENLLAHKDFYDDSETRTEKFEALEAAVAAAKKVTMPSADDIKALNTAMSGVTDLTLCADADDLKTAITTATSTIIDGSVELMKSSKDAFEANMKAAQELLDNWVTDHDKLTDAAAKLDVTAGDGDKLGEYVKATKTALTAYVDGVKNIPDSSFSDADYAKYIDALNEANRVSKLSSPTAKECSDAYETLREMVEKSAINNSVLTDLYNKVKDYKDYMFKDDNWTTFDAARTAAKGKLTSTDQVAVSDAYTTLKDAVEALEADAINKTTLQKAIADATKDKDEATYTVASWAKLQNVIKDAQALLDGTAETSLDIKTMQITTLPAAVSGLVAYNDVEQSVTDLLGANYYVLNKDAGKYTADSWKAYVAVRDNFAKELLNVVDDETMPTADSGKVAKYVSKTETLAALQKGLVKAYDSLVKVNADSLIELVAKAEKLVEKDYTSESWKTFSEALKVAKDALEDGTPSLITSAEKALQVAMDALKATEKSPAQFTKDLFENVMGRPASENDVEYYTNLLATNKNWTGAVLVKFFTTTDEFTKKNLDEEGYIKALYKMAFNREADASGLAYWKAEMAKEGRQMTTARILASKEFDAYCQANQVTTGELTVNAPAQNFIKGIYTATLGRSARPAEVLSWLGKLENKTQTGSAVVKAFLASPEFTGKNVSEEEYVKTLYKAFFGGVDEKGAAYWTAQIKDGKKTRKEALNFFATSDQFKKLCANAGIEM